MDLETELSQTLSSCLPLSETPQNLVDAIQYSLLAPGKRIRPKLLLACAEMLGLPRAHVLPAALAIEMVHCFTLIHDDLPCMDNDDFRRGRPSNHKVHGEALALLAGDGLFAFAFEIFSKISPHFERSAYDQAFALFCKAVGPKGVIGGQAAEMLLKPESTLNDLRNMHSLKTGALFELPLLVPAHLAALSPKESTFQSISQFAQALGFAFQVVDDLEDAEKDVGKPLSILYYLTQKQAALEAHAPLLQTTERLGAIFKAKAEPLLALSQTVSSRLAPIL